MAEKKQPEQSKFIRDKLDAATLLFWQVNRCMEATTDKEFNTAVKRLGDLMAGSDDEDLNKAQEKAQEALDNELKTLDDDHKDRAGNIEIEIEYNKGVNKAMATYSEALFKEVIKAFNRAGMWLKRSKFSQIANPFSTGQDDIEEEQG